MAKRPELDRWLQDTDWVADPDFEVSRDAMRCRPEPPALVAAPAPIGLLHSLPRPAQIALRPPPTREEVADMTAAANQAWRAIGRAYEELSSS